jgi:hypothetical protein
MNQKKVRYKKYFNQKQVLLYKDQNENEIAYDKVNLQIGIFIEKSLGVISVGFCNRFTGLWTWYINIGVAWSRCLLNYNWLWTWCINIGVACR